MPLPTTANRTLGDMGKTFDHLNGAPSDPAGSFYQAWVVHYNGPGDDVDDVVAMAADESGNVYVTGVGVGVGTGWDFATVKYNSAGEQQWVARYNGPDNGYDRPYAMAIDSFGNVYVTGYTGTADSFSDWTTIKYDSDGQQLWVARYNVCPRSYARGRGIAVDGSGNVYVTGSGESLFATIKYNSSGEEQWVVHHAPGESVAIATDNLGNIYVTGFEYDYVTVKYDSSGQEQWLARYNGPGDPYDRPAALAVDHSGNVYVTGASNLPGTYYDYATVKYNSAGQQQWASRYGQADGVFGSGAAIAVDTSGNVYVAGKVNDPDMYPDYGTIKYNSAGQQQWVARYHGPTATASDYAVGVALDGSGNVYVTGSSQRFAFYSDYDYATIKYDSAGEQQWVARYDGSVGDEDQARGIAVDGSDNVYVSGTSGGFYATVKYGQGPTPTPTPTATASPTSTATSTPTPSATASPTPTAICSPTPTPTASPTPTPSDFGGTPTSTPTATPTSSSTPACGGCSVTSPNCGITVFSPPTDFVVHLSPPGPGALQASDFTVNGISADSFMIVSGGAEIHFYFNTSPAVQGENTIHIAACAFFCASASVPEFTCTFLYEPSTPTPTSSPTPTPTSTPRPSPTPRPALTPRPRPTPPPRP